MNEQAAGQVLLLRAFETRGHARWSDADRAWATRSALQAVGGDAPAEAFLAARAQAALGRLGAQAPALPRWHGGWAWGAAALGLGFGLVVDHIGSAQRINLLAPPVWAVIAWNLVVYLLLLLPLLVAAAAIENGTATPASTFPNPAALLRLAGHVLIEQHDEGIAIQLRKNSI